MATSAKSLRFRALALYKELHRLGRDYEPSYDYHGKLRRLYEKNRHLKDEAEIEKALELGEYIKNDLGFVLSPQIQVFEADVPSHTFIRYINFDPGALCDSFGTYGVRGLRFGASFAKSMDHRW